MSTAAEDVMVVLTWDSGPIGVYYEADPSESPSRDWYGRIAAPIPRHVWERFLRAQEEFSEAEDALEQAKRDAVTRLGLEKPPRGHGRRVVIVPPEAAS